jgi:hypothetical protein
MMPSSTATGAGDKGSPETTVGCDDIVIGTPPKRAGSVSVTANASGIYGLLQLKRAGDRAPPGASPRTREVDDNAEDPVLDDFLGNGVALDTRQGHAEHHVTPAINELAEEPLVAVPYRFQERIIIVGIEA